MAAKDDPVAKKSRAHIIYKTSDGKRVPGVTTITGMLDKPGLVKWANNLGLQGIDSNEHVKNLARIGTCAHLMVACEWKGDKPDLSEFSEQEIDRAENSLISYWNWEKEHKIEPLMVEAPLVSEVFGFGGTLDCYALVDGIPTLLDLKTSKGIFPEHIMQIAALRNLLQENKMKVTNARILRIGRDETEGFEDHVVDLENLNPYWHIFFHLLEIYNLQKVIKKKGA